MPQKQEEAPIIYERSKSGNRNNKSSGVSQALNWQDQLGPPRMQVPAMRKPNKDISVSPTRANADEF